MAGSRRGGGVGDVSGFRRPAEGLCASGLLAGHEPSPVTQGTVEVDVRFERVRVLEYSPAVPADVALLTCSETEKGLIIRWMQIINSHTAHSQQRAAG